MSEKQKFRDEKNQNHYLQTLYLQHNDRNEPTHEYDEETQKQNSYEY